MGGKEWWVWSRKMSIAERLFTKKGQRNSETEREGERESEREIEWEGDERERDTERELERERARERKRETESSRKEIFCSKQIIEKNNR